MKDKETGEVIDLKYKIPLTGEYWAGINSCPECGFRRDTVTREIIGFAEQGVDTFTVCECPVCFIKWYFHARGLYKYFITAIEFKTQKHFKL